MFDTGLPAFLNAHFGNCRLVLDVSRSVAIMKLTVKSVITLDSKYG